MLIKGVSSLGKEVIRGSLSTTNSATPQYTAILRKVVGKSARDNPERHCGRF